MTADYREIRRENERRFGTEIGRVGAILLANRYDDRTHFIYELLQNAEDALAKRTKWSGSRCVNFFLHRDALHVTHFGKPFDDVDVRAICGIGETSKDLTAIGRFGIGFKSVYAFTERPEVHSGAENFAIESFVWPVSIARKPHEKGETLIVIPLRNAVDSAEITAGLRRLGVGTLMFLRQIDEIAWTTFDGHSGRYVRSLLDDLGDGVRRIRVIGQSQNQSDAEERWLIFSRPVLTPNAESVGNVEVAFRLAEDEKQKRETIRPVPRSPLVVFFPTVVETHLRFILQGPYRTTPSRDNIPKHDSWNERCIGETSELLLYALHWLRDHRMLDADALRCLPLEREKFDEKTMFGPLFAATQTALKSHALIPRFGGGYAPADRLKLARTNDLRELLGRSQLRALLGSGTPLAWVSSDISQDRTPDLHHYLTSELEIDEVRPESVISELTAKFLEEQSDEWVMRLYEFLGALPALHWRLSTLPLVRLEDGHHVLPEVNGRPGGVLPSSFATGFPTVRGAVCKSPEAKSFLRALGLTEPDPVDDVVWHVLPRYREKGSKVPNESYESDLTRILLAFATDSKAQREKLLSALRDTPFVKAIEATGATTRLLRAREIYIPTERLRALFAAVPGVFFLDNEEACLQGDNVRALLEACEATRFLQPIFVTCDLSWEEKRDLRRSAGLEHNTWERPIADTALRGLVPLLKVIPTLLPEERSRRALLLWEALGDYIDRRGARSLVAEYTFGYSHQNKTVVFDAAFVRTLNATEWVADSDGSLCQPQSVLFESLGWQPAPLLQAKILFKPPIVDELARAAGIEPGVLNLLKQLGVTSEEELRRRLLLGDEGDSEEVEGGDRLTEGMRGTDPDAVLNQAGSSGTTFLADKHPGGISEDTSGNDPNSSASSRNRFVSYVAASPRGDESSYDEPTQSERRILEALAIDFILDCEPDWHRAPENNPGFDLYRGDDLERATEWCEVKAMAGSLDERPIGMSRAQFRAAEAFGKSYLLYIVERAGTEEVRLLRIRDPAGKAETFTFDEGWIAVADVISQSR